MVCYYHPERESTDICAICGKSVCKECGLEIAGKVYCKECLEKIVGLGLSNATPQERVPAKEANIKSEPARLNKQVADESIYQPQEEYIEPITPEHEVPPQEEYSMESKPISDDSPYNIRDNINYTGGLESSYLQEQEIQPTPEPVETISPQPQNEFNAQTMETPQDDGFIYPDHSYEPKPRAGIDLEDKYERYLDDLYFDEPEVPLDEQLAKDEEEYGSLTKKPYRPKEKVEREVPQPERKVKKMTGEEEIEAKIRAEIAKEKSKEDKPIHNLNYQQEKEPYGAVDIILTVILVIVILIVIYYLIYLFFLNSSYPTFIDSVFALSNPQNVINNILK